MQESNVGLVQAAPNNNSYPQGCRFDPYVLPVDL